MLIYSIFKNRLNETLPLIICLNSIFSFSRIKGTAFLSPGLLAQKLMVTTHSESPDILHAESVAFSIYGFIPRNKNPKQDGVR